MPSSDSLLSMTRGYYDELKSYGLNPFDLLSWPALRNLWTTVVYAGRSGHYADREIHQRTEEMVMAALERKANALIQQAPNDDEGDKYREELDTLQNL